MQIPKDLIGRARVLCLAVEYGQAPDCPWFIEAVLMDRDGTDAGCNCGDATDSRPRRVAFAKSLEQDLAQLLGRLTYEDYESIL